MVEEAQEKENSKNCHSSALNNACERRQVILSSPPKMNNDERDSCGTMEAQVGSLATILCRITLPCDFTILCLTAIQYLLHLQ